MKICDRELCTGCSACAYVCPKMCISMTTDEIGHIVPTINKNLCIKCGACRNACPSVNAVEKNKAAEAYAAVGADEKEYITSSSGGAAAVFSRYIIENGGVVYGCTAASGFDIRHIRIDNLDELWKLKGSKYVESRTERCPNMIKSDLTDGKTVLFIGTPCQCAAVKKLFGGYKNLYIIDLICHGVPPQRLLKEHLDNKVNEKPQEIIFRENEKCFLCVKNGEKLLYKRDNLLDLYYTGFYKNLYFRHSCYACQYANANRVGDLTVGDFLGIGKSDKLSSAKYGISLILVNSEKGSFFLKECMSRLKIEKRTLKEAIDGNPQLRHPSEKHKNTEKFRKKYPKVGFGKAAAECLFINRIKYLLLFIYNQIIQ